MSLGHSLARPLQLIASEVERGNGRRIFYR